MRYVCFSFFLLWINVIVGQTAPQLPIIFDLQYEGNAISLVDDVFHSDKDDLTIETLRFYLSGIRLYNQSEVVYTEPQSYHLLDAEDSESLQFPLEVPKNISFTHIQFNIGLDSLTNVSGAMGGDLDPMYGMYWTWQSGYINFKLEGNAPICPTRKHQFQFHIGGYMQPYYSIQQVRLAVADSEQIQIQVAIDKLLHQIDLTTQHTIMSPNEKAMTLAALLPSIFSIAL